MSNEDLSISEANRKLRSEAIDAVIVIGIALARLKRLNIAIGEVDAVTEHLLMGAANRLQEAVKLSNNALDRDAFRPGWVSRESRA